MCLTYDRALSRLAWLQKNSPEPPTSAISPFRSTVFSSAVERVAVELGVVAGDLGEEARSKTPATCGSLRSTRVLKWNVSTMPLTEGCAGVSVLTDRASAITWSATRLAEALGLPRAGGRVGAHVAGGPLHEDALRRQLGFDLVLEEAGIVGRVLEELCVGHDRVRGEVDEDGDRLARLVVEPDDGQHRVGGLRLALGVPVAVQS